MTFLQYFKTFFQKNRIFRDFTKGFCQRRTRLSESVFHKNFPLFFLNKSFLEIVLYALSGKTKFSSTAVYSANFICPYQPMHWPSSKLLHRLINRPRIHSHETVMFSGFWIRPSGSLAYLYLVGHTKNRKTH